MTFLRALARFAGYGLASFGWFAFVICVLQLSHLPAGSRAFRVCGDFIVPGWLLLRFGAGLFPFGHRFFAWQRRRASPV